MNRLFRFGVSLDFELLKKFDEFIKKKNYVNRSKAIADLIRQEFVKKQWDENGEIAGTITLVYDHHKRDIADNLMGIQHDFQKIIVSTQHIHLDHNNCLEIVAVRGKSGKVRKLADILKSIKGVKHGTLNMTTTGKDI